MSKVSIITPVFNGERFVLDAAQSVLSQSYSDWEWIIVNDGSDDGTADILGELDDPRIQVITQSNAGVSNARNIGLACASGEYITFLDIDDTLPSEAIALRVNFLDAHSDIDIVNGGVCVTSEEQVLRLYAPDQERGPLMDRLARLEEGVFFNVCYMIRRSKVGNHRFPDGVSHCEDLIFFLTLAHDQYLNYGAVEDVVYTYRVQPSSAMSDLNGIECGYLELVKLSQNLLRLTPAIHNVQRRRIQRILVRSWLRRFRPVRAIAAILKLRKIKKTPI